MHTKQLMYSQSVSYKHSCSNSSHICRRQRACSHIAKNIGNNWVCKLHDFLIVWQHNGEFVMKVRQDCFTGAWKEQTRDLSPEKMTNMMIVSSYLIDDQSTCHLWVETSVWMKWFHSKCGCLLMLTRTCLQFRDLHGVAFSQVHLRWWKHVLKLLCENQVQLYCVGCMQSENFLIGQLSGVPCAGKRSPLSCQQSGDTAESQCTLIALQYRAFYRNTYLSFTRMRKQCVQASPWVGGAWGRGYLPL